jgi:ribose-phosphate pyrophosphokinase
MKVFSGSSNPELGEAICRRLGITQGDVYLHTFPSGERYCQFKENIRGEHVFLVQSTSNPTNDNLMELLVMCDAARRASAEKITVVMPYFGYSRQERKDKPRVPISAKLVMDMIGCAGATRIVTLDLHAPAVQGFTNLPVDQLTFKPALINALRSYPIDCIVSPDIGAIKRAEEYAEAMNLDLTVISKKRKGDTSVELHQFIGDVTNRNVLIVDDMTESGGTLIQAAKACKDKGAKTVQCAITHGCFTELGVQRLVESFKQEIIQRLFVSNSIKYTDRWIDPTEQEDEDGTVKGWDYFHVVKVDMAPMFAEAISRINKNQSVTELFK